MSEIKLQDKNDNWVLIIPIYGIKLTKEINHEIKISNVTFISAKKLSRVRKKFNIKKRISELDTTFFKDWNHHTYAIIQQTGTISDIKYNLYKIVEKELNIFLSSFFYFKRRDFFHEVSHMGLGRYATMHSFFISSTNSIWSHQGKAINLIEYKTDNLWIKNMKERHFFFKLLKFINKKNKFPEIKKVSTLIGKSFNSNDIVDAFLYNMIIIETLLTTTKDKQLEAIISRLSVFFDWLDFWNTNSKNKIKELYKKRNDYVHNLDYENISIDDLLYTDEIIYNLITNILNHGEIFYSKKALINFTKKIEAERTLGIKTKLTPKTFQYTGDTMRKQNNFF